MDSKIEVAPILTSDELRIIESLRVARAQLVQCPTIDPTTKMGMLNSCNDCVNRLFALAVLRMKEGVHYVFVVDGRSENPALNPLDTFPRAEPAKMTIAEMKAENERKITNRKGSNADERKDAERPSVPSFKNIPDLLPRNGDRNEDGPATPQ